MPWVSHDDAFSQKRKVFGLSDRAYRLYFCGLEYCARNLTDGSIRDDELPVIAAVAKIKQTGRFVAELEAGRLWVKVDGGHEVHDYLEHNRSAEEVKTERSRNAKRQRELRKRRAEVGDEMALSLQEADDSNGVRNALRNGVRNGGSHAAPAFDLDLASIPVSVSSTPAFTPGTDSTKMGKLRDACHIHPNTDDAKKLERAASRLSEYDVDEVVYQLRLPGVRDPLAYALRALAKRKQAP